MTEPLNTLVYKRTHRGDPDERGIFGVDDCMGRVRRLDFNAVIGVGGKRPDSGHEGIARRVNWIGIGREERGMNKRGPCWSFEFYRLLNDDGPELKELAPNLFRYMFEDHHVRFVLSQNLSSQKMQDEVQAVLRWAQQTPQPKPSPITANQKPATKRKCFLNESCDAQNRCR